MLPVIIIMYLFGRNDEQSYNAMMHELKELRLSAQMNKKQGDLVSAVSTAATLLQEEVTNVSGDLKEYEKDKAGPLEVRVQGLEKAVNELVDEGGGATSNKELVNVAREFIKTSRVLIEVYDEGLTSIKALRAANRQLDKDLTTKLEELKTCNGELRNCRDTK